MEQQISQTTYVLHELDLGRHILSIRSDGGVDLQVNDEQISCPGDNRQSLGLSLESDETYRLYISLQEYFKQNG